MFAVVAVVAIAGTSPPPANVNRVELYRTCGRVGRASVELSARKITEFEARLGSKVETWHEIQRIISAADADTLRELAGRTGLFSIHRRYTQPPH